MTTEPRGGKAGASHRESPEAESAPGLLGTLLAQRSLVLVVTAGLLLAGLVAVRSLPSGIYPEVDFPRIAVVARRADTPPSVLEASVVRPLEQLLAPVPGIRRVRTRIIRGAAEIALQFDDGTDMWRALQLVNAALASGQADLPAGVEVQAEKVTPADFPIVSYNVVGGTALARREVADLVIAPAFSRSPGVGEVTVEGGDTREIEVALDPAALAATGLRPSEAAEVLSGMIVQRTVGRLAEFRQTVAVTAAVTATDPAALAALPLVATAAGVVRLGDVATVFEGSPDRVLAVHGPEGDAVQVSVSRLVGASAPEVAHAVARTARELVLPGDLRLLNVYDQGTLIEESILGIRDAILLGILLTIGVLALFLRDPRAGFLAALSVPVTLVITFLVMALARQTLNLMSLGGMAIAIGLVIDDAIVVVEAVVRHLEQGCDVRGAVRRGLDEITGPVVGTTVTTVVVFLPLAFLSGVAGAFFRALAITLSAAVLVSLAFALFLLPVLAVRVLRAGRVAKRRHRDALSTRYAALLRRMLRHRGLLVAAAVVLAVLAGVFSRGLPSGFLPGMDEGAFVIDYSLPAGSSLEATEAAALRIEQALHEAKEIADWSRRTGAELGPITATETNTGDIAVLLVPRSRRREAEEIMADLRERLEQELPGVELEFIQLLEDVLADLSGSPRPLEIRILGSDHAVVDRLAGDVAQRLEDVPGLVDFDPGVDVPDAELRFEIDPVACVRAGLAPASVAADLATCLHGSEVGAVPRFDRLVPVRLRLADSLRFAPARLPTLPLAVGGTTVPLSQFAAAVSASGPSVLSREDLMPAVIPSGDLEGGDLGLLVRDVRKRLEGLDVPAGARVLIGGQVEGQERAFQELLLILVLGVAAVLTVLVGQFRSLRAGLLVLVTIPPAVLGGIISLAVTSTALDVSSVMGLVLLVGLVVKNGILIVQQALLRVRAGSPVRAAVVSAGRRRLRPILMTTLCTIFGLVPLALSLGAGSELQRPLAVAVIGGLLVSTVATLFVLPALAGLALGTKAPRAGST